MSKPHPFGEEFGICCMVISEIMEDLKDAGYTVTNEVVIFFINYYFNVIILE